MSHTVAGYSPSAEELDSFAMPMLGTPKRYSLVRSRYSTKDLQAEELQSELTMGEAGGSSADGIPQQEWQLLWSRRNTSAMQWQKAAESVI